jgi:hypothetical protein
MSQKIDVKETTVEHTDIVTGFICGYGTTKRRIFIA